jgi:uncharacterized protein YbaR (Trm112 family)
VRLEHLKPLACTACHERLNCVQSDADSPGGTITEGRLAFTSCKQEYPEIAGVPRFVRRENYASGFGLEWTQHARTQYDRHSGVPASEQRFFGQTDWPRDLTGEVVLEIRDGSGRLRGQMLKEWSYLDTFDMLAPRYDRPATNETFRQWAVQANLTDIDAFYSPHGVVLRARAAKRS